MIALAGRRIDPPDAIPPRFPLANIGIVGQRLRDLLRSRHATVLVSSAACGADLIALSEAGACGMRRRVVLPFDRERFRTSSVIDRPGDWGPIFDRVVNEVAASGDLIVLEGHSEEPEAYASANRAILDQAGELSAPSRDPAAVLVWEGASRGDDDLTAAFGAGAAERGFPVIHVKTL